MLNEEDDILKTKNLKKNLFELYRNDKNRRTSSSFGMTRNTLSPNTRFKRDSAISQLIN